MTREEAIRLLKNHIYPHPFQEWSKANNEAIDMAISALTEAENGCDGCLYEASDGSLFPCNICRLNYGCKYEKDDSNNITESPNEVVETDEEVIDLKGKGTIVTMSIKGAKERAIKTLRAEPSDLISRADAIEAVKSTKPMVRSTERNWGKMIAEQHSKELVKALKALPSADAVSREDGIPCPICNGKGVIKRSLDVNANVVEVVRCKDCKRANFDYPYPICNLLKMNISDDGFCNWAKKKGGAE